MFFGAPSRETDVLIVAIMCLEPVIHSKKKGFSKEPKRVFWLVTPVEPHRVPKRTFWKVLFSEPFEEPSDGFILNTF